MILSFIKASAQVDLQVGGVLAAPSQVCTTDSAPLIIQITNTLPGGNPNYTLSNPAQSIIVTLTLSGGNTFSPSGLTTKVHTYTSVATVSSGSPANTLVPGGYGDFAWPTSKPIVFTNGIQADIQIQIATGGTTGVGSETGAALTNNTWNYSINIVADPDKPDLIASGLPPGTYGNGSNRRISYTP